VYLYEKYSPGNMLYKEVKDELVKGEHGLYLEDFKCVRWMYSKETLKIAKENSQVYSE